MRSHYGIGRITAASLLLVMVAGVALAQPVVRLEVHPLPSVTLKTTDILSGRLDGAPVILGGELRIPGAGTDRLPAVVLVHGSGGLGPNIDAWARDINSLGIAVFILDSFTGRGITSTVSDESQLDNLAMMTDAYRALALLGKHSRIDPKRIAVMGFSKGAVAAVYSANERFRKLYDPSGPGFAAHIGLYTPCFTRFRDDERTTGAPIRLFHGIADDYVPVVPCREYVERLRQAKSDVTLTEYPGAWHAYDSIRYQPTVNLPDAATSRNCRLREGANGAVVNATTGAVFTLADPCMERGAHVGFNQDAYEATRVAVKDFLKRALKP
jgi:dienelactone hydrolase